MQATVIPQCTINVTNLDFGSAGLLKSARDGTSTMSIVCTRDAAYSIGLNGGLSNATNPTQRKMTLGAQSLTYGLCQGIVRQTPWGNTTDTGANVLGGSDTGTPQTLTVYGRVPAQVTPPAGSYTDTVVVTITY